MYYDICNVRDSMAAKNMDDIAELFSKMRFRKKVFGGVDERDVWRQLEKIQAEYRSAYEAQAVYYETLLSQQGVITSQKGLE